jgi:RecG-like helicase
VTSWWARIRASRREEEATDLQAELVAEDLSPIRECTPGSVVDVVGTVRSVILRPRSEAPALEVELYDGTGTLHCVWLGRRSIAGIRPGRRMVVHGRLTCTEDHPTVFNPRYELKPEPA